MTPRLLLVEDDDSDIHFLRRALRELGADASFDVAPDGRRALEVLADAAPPPTHVLLDLKLPELSGFEVLAWIRAQPRLEGIHAAVFTSSSEEADIERARELRAERYFVKPMSFARLLEVAKEIDLWMRTGPLQGPT